ncbi:MAG: neuraminidase-like domain-containing protein [Pseudomonadota bacterium]
MNQDQLAALAHLAHLTPSAMKSRDPELFDAVADASLDGIKTTLKERLSDASDALQKSVEQVAAPAPADRRVTPRAFVLEGLEKAGADEEQIAEAESRISDLPLNIAALDSSDDDQPMSRHTSLSRLVRQGQAVALAQNARIGQAKIGKLVENGENPQSLTADHLAELVEDGTLSQSQARRIGLQASLFSLLDENLELLAKVNDDALGVGRLTDESDLVKAGREAWTALVGDVESDPPDGLGAEEYAAALEKRVRNAFPEATLAASRPDPMPANEIRSILRALEPLTVRNPSLYSAMDFEKLDLSDVPRRDLDQIEQRYRKFKSFINAYPGQALAEMLDDPELSTSEKSDLVRRRTNAARMFFVDNRADLWLRLDLSDDSEDLDELDFDAVPKEEMARVLETVRRYQLVHAIAPDPDDMGDIIKAGYSNSLAIVNRGYERFATTTGFETPRALRYFAEAMHTVGAVTGMMGSMIDVMKGGLNATAVGNLTPSIEDHITRMRGYENLFGSQDFCACEHCNSILSPAAYFVDLMRFVDQHVLGPSFRNFDTEHVLHLKNRRPDLWTLELSCDNTNKTLPTLAIINRILEHFIARGNVEDGTDDGAIHSFVYRDALSERVDSFALPFHLPLARIDTYLEHFQHSRGDLADILGVEGAARTIAKLGLSPLAYRLIATPTTKPSFLRDLFEVDLRAERGSSGHYQPFDAQLLVKAMGVSRDELGALIKSKFVTENGNNLIRIVGERRSAESVQNDIEVIRDADPLSLDRLHRLARLLRVLPWSAIEVDFVLNSFAEAEMADELNEDGLAHIADVAALQERLDQPLDELSVFWGDIPDRAIDTDRPSLFDRLFNLPDIVRLDGMFPMEDVGFLHPGSGDDVDRAHNSGHTLHRLLGGLRIDDDGLFALIENLGDALTPAEEGKPAFALSRANLTLLYRHARLAQHLRLPIGQLFQLMTFAAGGEATPIHSLADLSQLLNFHEWWRSTKFSLDDLGFVIGGSVGDVAAYPAAPEIAATILAAISAERPFDFTDAIFSFADGVTEEQSRAVVEANAGRFESAGDDGVLCLAASFDIAAPLTIPAGIGADESALRAMLVERHVSHVLPAYLAGAFGQLPEKTLVLAKLSGPDLTDPDLVDALHGNGDTAPLVGLIDAAARLSVLFADTLFDDDAMAFVADHAAMFGQAELAKPDLDTVRDVARYRHVLSVQKRRKSDRADLYQALGEFRPGLRFARTDQQALARALGIEIGLSRTLQIETDLPTTALAAFEKLAGCADLAGSLGLSGDAFSLVLSDDFDDLAGAADALLAAMRAKYDDEAAWREILEPFEDRIRERQRDALTDYIIETEGPFESREDLYGYFLIDVSLEGCARTSLVTSAISSLQLYVHRVLTNLEQDGRDIPEAQKVRIQPDQIPRAEWAWRKNYRLWEANRKVFLYPESFIEPDLRDNKTALFEELEQSLLQREISEQTALEAYATYLKGFEEIANLEITGAYHQKDELNDTDVLHMFGATQKDPPTFYHRAVRNLYHSHQRSTRGIDWSHWRKLELQASSRFLSPVAFNGRLYVFWHDLATRSRMKLTGGESKLDGYIHKAKISYAMANLDGSWTAPQALTIGDSYPFRANWEGSLTAQMMDEYKRRPKYSKGMHLEPHDSYTLTGWQWEKLYPINRGDELRLGGFNMLMNAPVDMFRNRTTGWIWPWGKAGDVQTMLTPYEKVLCSQTSTNGSVVLFSGAVDDIFVSHHVHAAVALEDKRIDGFVDGWTKEQLTDQYYPNLYQSAFGVVPGGTEFLTVNGSFEDAFVQTDGDVLLLQGSVRDDRNYVVRRIGTTVAEEMARTLFERGIDGFLDIQNQQRLGEAPNPVSARNQSLIDFVEPGLLDFNGSLGVYFREIFFHIPFLIANHMNSQGRFEEAQRWYHFIFDPTAAETVPEDGTVPPADRDRQERDRVWQYVEFRGRTVESLNDTLTDRAAIEAYKSDPFNPHAIARLRLSAYQKSVVMKYVDNLLDWADQLFARDTRESINEATMLYVLAAQVLGERPQQLGPCEEVSTGKKTFARIEAELEIEPETAIQLEGQLRLRRIREENRARNRRSITLDRRVVNDARLRSEVTLGLRNKGGAQGLSQSWGPAIVENPPIDPATAIDLATMTMDGQMTGMDKMGRTASRAQPRSGTYFDFAAGAGLLNTVERSATVTAGSLLAASGSRIRDGMVNGLNWTELTETGVWDWRLAGFGTSFMRQLAAVFCVPENETLRDYWDRVEDRLYKIRNCLNIGGERRQLALFAPPIDPRLLVRARAAGLSIEDVLDSTSGNLPPYRFVFLIEKAKEYTRTLQSFGSSLLSAIEKKDVEELARLRVVHQDNLAKLMSAVRDQEIDLADESKKTLEGRKATLESKRDHYQSLIDTGLNAMETTQLTARHASSVLYGAASALDTVAAIAYLVPSVGSPFTFEYGGREVGDSGASWAQVTRSLAGVSDAIGSSAGLEASFDRRAQGWKHQLKQTELELAELDTQIEAADIRREIADAWKQHHKKSLDHIEEIDAFYGDKFSNLGLYTYLSATLQRLYRETYNAAYAMARLAEQAFLFERGADSSTRLRGGYWQSPRAGLLAGEQLYLDLQAMERRFIETNYRELEIDQAFSVAQIDPAALMTLKQTGQCDFAIPEVFFDLFYPGQYKRRIKAARLTIPCVTGPYTNVSASLSLMGSKIRMKPELGETFVQDVPRTRSVSIAASSAQNDSGVFEFSFRDERYMPFEGAGAVSQWQLRLPKTMRPFDYNTINDVILSISYTAEEDGVFREEVEQETGALEGAIVQVLQDNPLHRSFSIRQEFGNAYHMLLASPEGTKVKLKLDERHLPIFLQGKPVLVDSAFVVVQLAPGHEAGGLAVELNGREHSGFTNDPRFGGLPAVDLGSAFSAGIIGEHELAITAAGDLGPDGGNDDPAALSADKVVDVYVHLSFRLE